MIDTFVLKHKSASLTLILWDETRATLIGLHSTEKRKGHASQLLQKLNNFCDAKGLTVLLEVDAFEEGGMSNPQLKMFYEKFDFVLVDEEDESILMERKPK